MFRIEPRGTPAFRGQIEEAKASKTFEKEWPLNKEKRGCCLGSKDKTKKIRGCGQVY